MATGAAPRSHRRSRGKPTAGCERLFFLADHNTFYNHQLIASEASDLPAGRQASGFRLQASGFRKNAGRTPDVKGQ